MQPMTPPVFRTRKEIERYFGGKTIKCLICGRRFQRLGFHLATKHDMSADDYRGRFGLPWSRGLTSAASRSASGWTTERKAKAKRLAHQSRFFELAHSVPRRKLTPLVLKAFVKNLGAYAVGFGEEFKAKVHVLFYKGLTDAEIARALNVGRATVTYCAMHLRKAKRKR